MSARQEVAMSLSVLCANLATDAQRYHDVPPTLADEAGRITASALAPLDRDQLSERDCARVHAYFWAVVRRRALRMPSASRFTARIVRASIAEDLRRDGFGDERIAMELDRCAV